MNDFLLFVTGPLPGAALPASYNGWLVTLSYVVAALASYTAIDLAARVREFRAEPRKAAAWLIGGAVAMGAGIWAMHFVAMLAYQLPLPVRYELWTTLASMAAAIVTSGFALFILTHYTLTVPRLALSGAVMGAGISTMHYTGMAAMRLDALLMYYAWPFALSVFNAVVCSTAALWLVARRTQTDTRSRVLAAAVMGVAIVGMHYTGMYATVCVSTGKDPAAVAGIDPALLALAITVITLLIMGMALAVSLQSQLMTQALREQNVLLKNEIEQKRRMEAELQSHRDHLQVLVDARTRDLSRANHDLLESEARLRATFEQAAVGIAHFDLQQRNIKVNRRYSEITGYAPAELLGKSPGLLSHPDDIGMGSEQRVQLLSGAIDHYAEDKRYLRKDGTAVWVTRTESLARDDAGAPLYYIRVIEDITQRKQAEEARASLEVQLRESHKMQAIGTLAGGIAHDFNNILSTIMGNVELAQLDTAGNPAAQQSLEEIRKAGSRARDLVQQILAFSRRQPVARRPLDLAPLVAESVGLLRATLPARLSIEVHCDTNVPAVLADATQIKLALINLATNAMQAMPSGPGRIRLWLDTVILDAARAQADPRLRDLHAKYPGRTVRLTLSDSGKGMDAATLARVFEPFFTTKPVNEGTGLGLSVVHGIMQSHEGAIVLDSQPGKGTTATLYLPPAAAPASALEATLRLAATPAPAPGTGPRLLHIDDDAMPLMLFKRLFERRGYRVTTYTDAQAALEALRADPSAFDLVLTDYNMPDLSGLDVARRVRAIRADLPVAVLSGFIDEALHAQATAAGVRVLISKADPMVRICEVVQHLAQTSSVNPATS